MEFCRPALRDPGPVNSVGSSSTGEDWGSAYLSESGETIITGGGGMREAQLNAVVRELLAKGGGGYPPDQQVKEARTQITYCKNMMFSDADVEARQVDGMDFPSVYKGYQAFLLIGRAHV